jgi:hypothetical protein
MDNGLPVLDLYERYSKNGEMFLTGAFGGVKIFIHPIKGAHPDDRPKGRTSHRDKKASIGSARVQPQ